jgi:hypothetical protein
LADKLAIGGKPEPPEGQIMSLTLKKMPRAGASAQKIVRDPIVDKTKEQLQRIKDGVFSEHAVKSHIAEIYIGFNFDLMHSGISSPSRWKSLVNEFDGMVSLSKANAYMAVGQHFLYDKAYITYLNSIDIGVPPSRAKRHLNIGTQLAQLAGNGCKFGLPGAVVERIMTRGTDPIPPIIHPKDPPVAVSSHVPSRPGAEGLKGSTTNNMVVTGTIWIHNLYKKH